jgi:Na+/melibiose symporter-like transporter
LLFSPSAYADVSYSGRYIAVTVVLLMLFFPVFIVALTRRTRKKQYLMVLILWAMAAFAYLWFTGGSENEFYLSLLLPYILLVAYLFKEKKLGRVVE